MARCIIYTRVSTTPQATGTGLVRQLEECIRYAASHRINVAGVYTDICSGAGTMPNREIAYREHVRLKCPILVETRCRWSRHRHEDDPLIEANVVCASEHARDMEARIACLVREMMTNVKS